MQTSAGFCQEVKMSVFRLDFGPRDDANGASGEKKTTHHHGGEEADGHWQHLLHLILAGLGDSCRQVVAQFVQSIHDLFLK